MIDPVEFGKQMGAIVREAMAPLQKRIEELESAKPAEIDIDAIARAAAEQVSVPEPKEPDMDEIKRHAEQLIKIPEVPSVDQVAAVFERRFSDLALSWERQARETFEKAADRMPVPKDGRDAIPLDSFDLTLSDDGRTVTVKMQAGETVVEKSLKIGSVIDRGTYKAAESYEQGDAVTHGGSLWIAQQDAPEGAPGLGGKGWRLAVKKGRDGKDLRNNSATVDKSKGVSLS